MAGGSRNWFISNIAATVRRAESMLVCSSCGTDGSGTSRAGHHSRQRRSTNEFSCLGSCSGVAIWRWLRKETTPLALRLSRQPGRGGPGATVTACRTRAHGRPHGFQRPFLRALPHANSTPKASHGVHARTEEHPGPLGRVKSSLHAQLGDSPIRGCARVGSRHRHHVDDDRRTWTRRRSQASRGRNFRNPVRLPGSARLQLRGQVEPVVGGAIGSRTLHHDGVTPRTRASSPSSPTRNTVPRTGVTRTSSRNPCQDGCYEAKGTARPASAWHRHQKSGAPSSTAHLGTCRTRALKPATRRCTRDGTEHHRGRVADVGISLVGPIATDKLFFSAPSTHLGHDQRTLPGASRWSLARWPARGIPILAAADVAG